MKTVYLLLSDKITFDFLSLFDLHCELRQYYFVFIGIYLHLLVYHSQDRCSLRSEDGDGSARLDYLGLMLQIIFNHWELNSNSVQD